MHRYRAPRVYRASGLITTCHRTENAMKVLLALTPIAAAAALGFGVAHAQALSPADYAVVQRVTNEYLTSLPKHDYYDVMAEDVFKRIQGGKQDFVIVDVRVPKDKKFDQGHLPGAMFIGVMDLARPENLAKLPRDKDIIVHCDTGQQQNKAVTVLRLLGYNAYAMKWGYMSWRPAGPTAATLDQISASMTKNYPIEK
jgi:rhodanese-related sulfurtransferase